MRESLVLVFLVTAALGCKTDAPASSGSASGAREDGHGAPSSARPRSAKIDLAPKRSGPATDDASDDSGATVQGLEDRRSQRRAAMDTDGDGDITHAERLAARKKRDEEIQARLDTDGDGIVSEAERAAARHDRAQNLHARLDRDGDGKLDAGELEAGPFRRLDVGAADTDGDGVVSVDELDTAIAQRKERKHPRPFGGRRRGGGDVTPPAE